MTPERRKKFEQVVAQRQFNLTVILENVHDPHNIGAVLRSCDAVGIREIYVLYTQEALSEANLSLERNTSTGAGKWVDIHYFTDLMRCFEEVRKKYERIFCTRLTDDAASLFDMDLTQSMALLFGNEHLGVSEEASGHCDGNFVIPQMGMVESLNISVACAVSLFEAARQRMVKGFYDHNLTSDDKQKKELFETYIKRHKQALDERKLRRKEGRKKRK